MPAQIRDVAWTTMMLKIRQEQMRAFELDVERLFIEQLFRPIPTATDRS